jgi:peptidoglycan/LPS O-acetylase OafA/YrhL
LLLFFKKEDSFFLFTAPALAFPPIPVHCSVAMNPGYRPFGAFRFLLAMMVLAQHGLLVLPPAARDGFYDWELGAVAVTVFFALSGFIVAEALDSFYAGRPVAFLLNRALRIVPPYLAALVLALAVDAALAEAGRLVPLDAPLTGSPLHWRIILASVVEIIPGLPAHRISGQDFSPIPFAWTLRVEFAFYLAAFAVSLARTRMPPAIIPLALMIAYTGFALFAWRQSQGDGSAPMQLLCIPFFGFGIGLYALERRPGAAARLHLHAVACACLLAFTFWHQRGHPVLLYQLPLLAALFTILGLLARRRAIGPKIRRWDRRLGDLTYPLYISHGIVLTLLRGLTSSRGALSYAAAILLSLALAATIHASIERPLTRLRTRIRGAAT